MSLPPPYSTDLAPSESTVPTGTPLRLSTTDILGVREQILGIDKETNLLGNDTETYM